MDRNIIDRKRELKGVERYSLSCRIFLALLLAYGFLVIRDFRSYQLGASLDPEELARAVQAAPWNSDLYLKKAALEEATVESLDGSEHDLKTATRLNPYPAGYWLELAKVEFMRDEWASAQTDLERAVGAERTTTAVAWDAAILYLAMNQRERAIALFREIADQDPELGQSAFQLLVRAGEGPAITLDKMLGTAVEPHFALIQLFLDHKEADLAIAGWQHLVATKNHFSARLAFPLVQALIDDGEPQKAAQVWMDLQSRSPELSYAKAPDELFTNGNLEQEVLNGGMDWRYHPVANIEAKVDGEGPASQVRSLLIVYDHAQGASSPVTQMVVVQPGTEYNFSASVKVDELTSADGPELRFRNVYDSSLYPMTPELQGTQGWHTVQHTFATSADTHLLIFEVAASPGSSLINGQLRLAEVHLSRK